MVSMRVTGLLARLVGTVLVKLRMFILSRGDAVNDTKIWPLGSRRDVTASRW